MRNYKSEITYKGNFSKTTDLDDAKMVYEDISFLVKKHLPLEYFGCKNLDDMVSTDLIKEYDFYEGELVVKFWSRNNAIHRFERCVGDFTDDLEHTELNVSKVEDLLKSIASILEFKVTDMKGIQGDRIREIVKEIK